MGAGADVRGDDDVGQAEERVVGRRGLLVEHVGGVGEQVIGLERGDEGIEVHEFTATGVDDDSAFFDEREILRVDQALGRGREFGVERNEIGAAENVVEIFHALDIVPAGEVFVPVVAVADHFQTEGAGADGDLLADPAETDDGEGFAADLVAGDARPAAGGDVVGFDDEVAHGGEEEGKGMLGDGGVVDAGSEEDGEFQVRGGLEVDLVEADAIFGDDLEAREGFFHHGAGHGVITAKIGVELAGEFQHAGLGERAAFSDDFKAGGGEHVVMDARRVLKGCGGQEDSGHEWVKENQLYRVEAGGLPLECENTSMPSFGPATRKLKSKLGRRVSTDHDALFAASFDGSKLSFLPEAVIKPKTKADIAEVLGLANKFKVPVTMRGAGTSLTGSGSPIAGGWVLDVSGWNKITVDAEAGFAQVQAGAVVGDIHKAVEALGWFYPPDPASKKYCTIGGNIACNAGGMHGGKYGVTRDFVVALKGFLPTGEYVEWGVATKKFSSGFNLRDLWIGSEGMLGVVTEATLKLIPLPAARWTLLTAFADEAAAFRAVRALFAQRVQPAICEFLDRYSVQCAETKTGKAVFAGQAGRPVVLLELAGSASELAEQKEVVLAWAKANTLAFREAHDRIEAEELWEVRRKCSPAMFALGDSKLNEDIVIPMRSYEKFVVFLDRLRKSSRLAIPTFGHLGDGNLHVNIMYHRDNRAEYLRAEKAVGQLMAQVVKLGGAIFGEHGIGLAKTPFLALQHSPAQIKAMKAVKDALDPNGILNPGKMFTLFKVAGHPRLKITLPWDQK